MFPTPAVLYAMAAFAAAMAMGLPFKGVSGYLKNLIVCGAFIYGLLAIGVLLGLIFHSAFFGEPVYID